MLACASPLSSHRDLPAPFALPFPNHHTSLSMILAADCQVLVVLLSSPLVSLSTFRSSCFLIQTDSSPVGGDHHSDGGADFFGDPVSLLPSRVHMGIVEL